MAKKYTRPGKAARLEMLERVKKSYYGLDEISQISVDKLISKSGYDITGIFSTAGAETLSKTKDYKAMFDVLKKYEKVLFKTAKGVKKQKTDKELSKYLSKYDKTLPNWARKTGVGNFSFIVGGTWYDKDYTNTQLSNIIAETFEKSIYKERLQALKGTMRYEDWMELMVEREGNAGTENMSHRFKTVYDKSKRIFDKVRKILIENGEDEAYGKILEFDAYNKRSRKGNIHVMSDEVVGLYKKIVEYVSKSKISKNEDEIVREVYDIITHKTRTSARISMK